MIILLSATRYILEILHTEFRESNKLVLVDVIFGVTYEIGLQSFRNNVQGLLSGSTDLEDLI